MGVSDAASRQKPSEGRPITDDLVLLSSNKERWRHKTSFGEKVKFIDGISRRLQELDYMAWARENTSVYGFDPDDQSSCVGMNMLATECLVPALVINGLLKKLRALFVELDAGNGTLKAPLARTTAGGSLAVSVFPLDTADKMGVGAMGVKGEVWLEPGVKEAERVYEGAKGEGKVSLVLGAGNQTFLGVVDVLDQLFLEGAVVLFKIHELRVGSHDYISHLFAELISEGFMRVLPVSTSRENMSKVLPVVDEVHITGGAQSAHRILWGDSVEEQKANIAASTPRVKSIKAELGNVTPYMICPGGAWKSSDLKHHASYFVQMVVMNCSCNCLSPKVLVLSKEWEHCAEFIRLVKEELAEQPLWPAYYPGVQGRYDAYAAAYPSAQIIHTESAVKPGADGQYTASPSQRCIPPPLPWLLVELDGTSVSDEEYALRNEAFAPCLAIVSLPAAKPEEFLTQASALCRNKLWGSLVASVIVHPDVEKQDQTLIDRIVPQLPYGSVVINSAGTLGYQVETAVWGAFPGEKLEAMQSGVGQIKNLLCLRSAQQSVVRCPFISALHLKRGQNINPVVATSMAHMLVKPCLRSVSTFLYSLVSVGFAWAVSGFSGMRSTSNGL
jgi:hypothetical protein